MRNGHGIEHLRDLSSLKIRLVFVDSISFASSVSAKASSTPVPPFSRQRLAASPEIVD